MPSDMDFINQCIATADDALLERYKKDHLNLADDARLNIYYSVQNWKSWVNPFEFEKFLQGLAKVGSSDQPSVGQTDTEQDQKEMTSPPVQAMTSPKKRALVLEVFESGTSENDPTSLPSISKKPKKSGATQAMDGIAGPPSPQKDEKSKKQSGSRDKYHGSIQKGPAAQNPCARCKRSNRPCHLAQLRNGSLSTACYHCRAVSHVGCFLQP